MRQGDLISLIIDARDRDHVCDLTEIDLTITQMDGESRVWSLSEDCADTIDAANPHADRFGHESIWHFFAGPVGANETRQVIPPESLLAQWLDTSDREEAAQLAVQIQELVTRPEAPDSPADAELRRQLTSLGGPIFSPLDFAILATRAREQELADATCGLDPQQFGFRSENAVTDPQHLVVSAPSVLEIKVPCSVLAGSEFVVTGTLHETASEDASVQMQITSSEVSEPNALLPGIPIVVRNGSSAEAAWQKALGDFRDLFPVSMCYARIVPVDEVVTLVLFHREDEFLARLMLSDAERARLDRLWDELRYVSRDALTSVAAYEQLMEFATQDGDPKLFEPLRKPITERAEMLQRQLVDSEPAHLAQLLDLASLAYRRPLSERETRDLRELYDLLRQQPLPHEEAFRLTLARVLVAPPFLYRLEQPAPGAKPSAVSNWELATRLSYFLWSSVPDNELRELAATGRLRDAETLRHQTHRMLREPRVRRLAIEFGCQWLQVRDFDQIDEKSERYFPTFATVRGAMYEESILYFTDFFQHDRSVLSMLEADYTFLNEQLARHYGIAGVTGDHWRRVDGVGKYSRGGILSLATVLSKQSGTSRTSPILRGNWVSETLLGERLPRPPKNVPQLPESVPDNLTERQLIEKHSSDAACRKCHARIDPYGFALEHFDAIGRFRQQDASGHTIDTETTLPDGTSIDGADGLRDYLLNVRRETFIRHFCRKLLGYALGRAVQLSDEPLLDKIMGDLVANDYRLSTAVEAIVLSDQFRRIRGRDAE